MQKQVLIHMDGRKLILKFEETDDLTGYDAMKTAFDEVFEKDAHLQKLGKKKFPLFSCYNEEWQMEVDLYSGCEVSNMANIKLSFQQVMSPQKQCFIPTASTSNDFRTSASSNVVYFDDNTGRQIPIIVEDLRGKEIQTPAPVEGVQLPDCSAEEPTHMEPNTHVDEVTVTTEADLEDAIGEGENVPLPEKKIKLVYPTPIPNEDSIPKLKQLIQNKRLLVDTNIFIEIAASFLEDLKPYPTQSEYDAYCSTLIQKYPELADKTKPLTLQHVTLKKMVTNKMRNERARRKQKLLHPKEKKRGALYGASAPVPEKKRALSEQENPLSSHVSEEIDEPKSSHSGVPMNEILTEMKKEIDDPSILETVLKKTFDERRAFVLEAKTAKEIWDKWPAMKSAQAVYLDHQLIERFNRIVVLQKYGNLVKVLVEFFHQDEDHPLENDALQAEVFARTEAHLHPKVSKLLPKAITALKVGETTPDKLASNAPIAAVYSQKKKLINAFILAENETIFQIKKASMFQVIESLLASYYAFNIKFPPAYTTFFAFIEYCLYGKPITQMTKSLALLKNEFDKVQ